MGSCPWGRRAPVALAVLAVALLPACIALQSDVRRLSGRLSYLETRLERTEELIGEASGEAEAEVLRSRRELRQELQQLRSETVRLTAQLQGLVARLQRVEGRLDALDRRIAALEQSPAAVGASPSTTSEPPSPPRWRNEEEAYAAARAAFDAGDMERAAGIFRRILKRWPEGRYAGNARFWLGEIAYRRKDYLGAIEHYLAVVDHHPKSPKAPAAYYKMGLALEALGQHERARRIFAELRKRYPDSEQARRAARHLKERR